MHRPVRKLTSSLVFAFIASAAVPAGARAQEPRRLAEPDSVPLELAAALVSAGGFGAEPQILVGSVPEWIAPRLFVPAGARVLGSAFLGTTIVAVVTLPSASDLILADVRRGLLQKGWTPAPPTPMYSGGGFRPASMSVPSSPFARDVLCSDQQVMTATATRRRGVATDITLRITTSPGYSPCHPVQPYQPAVRSTMPTLFNPVGVTEGMSMECNSSMVGSTGTSATYRTPMAADVLLDHYGKQMTDSGWTVVGERASISGRTWTRTDSAGNPIETSITVKTGRESGCRELNMQVRTLRKP
ncbi:MAG TPA: hypothetical protein VGH04_04965 [Gemmatimonadaceae bacterium]